METLIREISTYARNIPSLNGARVLSVVDLENLAGGANHLGTTSKAIRALVRSYQRTESPVMNIVSTGVKAVRLYPELLWDWKQARFLIGRGIDGADKELLHVLENEPAVSKATCVQIWSGDHCFAPIAQTLRARGIYVHVFGRSGALSRELKSAANETTTVVPLADLQKCCEGDSPAEQALAS